MMNVPSFRFRMPRSIDPRRHHDLVEWATADREARRHVSRLGWRERAVYVVLAAGLLLVVLAALARLLA